MQYLYFTCHAASGWILKQVYFSVIKQLIEEIFTGKQENFHVDSDIFSVIFYVVHSACCELRIVLNNHLQNDFFLGSFLSMFHMPYIIDKA